MSEIEPQVLKESTAGTYGWALLGAGVLAWDLYAPETLSHAADRALEHKSMKYVAWAIGGVVGGHVFNLIPEKYDVIQQSANYVGRKMGL